MRSMKKRVIAFAMALMMAFVAVVPSLAFASEVVPGDDEQTYFDISFNDDRGNVIELGRENSAGLVVTYNGEGGDQKATNAVFEQLNTDGENFSGNGGNPGKVRVYPEGRNKELKPTTTYTVWTAEAWQEAEERRADGMGTVIDRYVVENKIAVIKTNADRQVIADQSDFDLIIEAPEFCINLRAIRMDNGIKFHPVEGVTLEIVKLKTKVDTKTGVEIYELDENKDYIATDKVIYSGTTNPDGRVPTDGLRVTRSCFGGYFFNGVRLQPGELLGVRQAENSRLPSGIKSNEKVYAINPWNIENIERYDVLREIPRVDSSITLSTRCVGASVVYAEPSVDIPVYAYVDRYENETIKPVEGAVFGIYKITNTDTSSKIETEAEPFAKVTTDKNGYATFRNVTNNEFFNTLGNDANVSVQVPYVVKQISAPSDVEMSGYTYQVRIDFDDSGNPNLVAIDNNGRKITMGTNSEFDDDLQDDAASQRRLLFPHFVDSINRIAGDTRYATSVEIAKETYPRGLTSVSTERGDRRFIVLSTGQNFPDTLGGMPLTAAFNAPMLLTRSNGLSEEVKEFIAWAKDKETAVTNAVILGGESAVSPQVVRDLTALGIEVQRVSGSDRYSTAVQAGETLIRILNDGNTQKFLHGWGNEQKLIGDISSINEGRVFLANGEGFADALTASVPARQFGTPILLTRTDSVPAETMDAIKSWNVKEVVIVGGKAAVSEAVEDQILRETGVNVTRYEGANRAETAMAMAGRFYPNSNEAFVARDDDYADALSGSLLAAKRQAPILLIKRDSVPEKVAQYIIDENITEITILGGRNAVTDAARAELNRIILEAMK